MKHIYLTSKHLFTALFLVLTMSFASAQHTITGVVTDEEENAPMPGVNVIMKGTTKGTVTDIDGKYQLEANEDDILVFSFVGYINEEVQVGKQSVIDVKLTPDITSLDEILVIGYGEVKKEDATGAVAAISNKDFNKAVISAPQDLIVGKMAGVIVTPADGSPGGGAKIRIRGGSSLTASNDPLYVIDGFPVDNDKVNGMPNPLSLVNPQDIESVTILKDASATAIYGSRASNGVVLITTKKGSSNKPLQVSYNGTFSMSTPIKYVDVLNGDEYRELAKELAESGKVSGLAPKDLALLGKENTNWQDLVYRDAFSMDHNVSVNGALKGIPYRAAYGYTGQDGILDKTNMKRNTISFSMSPILLDNHLKVNVNWKSVFMKQNFSNTGAIGAAVNFDPTQPVYSGNPAYGGYYTWLADEGKPNNIATSNPVALIEQTTNTSKINRYIGNISLDYKLPFLPELRTVLNMGIDKTSSEGQNDSPNDAAFTYRAGIGQQIDYTQDKNSELLDFYMNYVKEIDKHRIDLTGGYSWQHFKNESFNYSRNGGEPGVEGPIKYIKNDSSITAGEYYLVSFFGRVNYTLANRYLFTATLRNDGSSRFPKDNRWGLFPAFAFAWKINDEQFLKNSNVVSNLKLRMGYGVTGQQDIGDSNYYPYIAAYNISQPTAWYQFGNQFYKTRRPSAYNSNIKWEETTTYNVGLDFGFLNDKISGAFELYKRKTNDLLNEIQIAGGSNLSNYLVTNIGNLENQGVEVTLNYRPITTEKFSWRIGSNVTYNQNKITKLTATNAPDYPGANVGGISGGSGNTIQNHNVGYSAFSYYVFEQVYDENGKPIEGLYVDRSGEGGNVAGNVNNKYHYKKPTPDYMIGINSSVKYQNFDFSFSGRLSLGNYVYNNVVSENARYSRMLYQQQFYQNLHRSIYESNFVDPQYFSNYYVENASFFKMDNISMGYDFSSLISMGKLKARASFTVQNAFIITNYSGLDPEVSGGIDNNVYPRPRTYLFGINLTY